MHCCTMNVETVNFQLEFQLDLILMLSVFLMENSITTNVCFIVLLLGWDKCPCYQVIVKLHRVWRHHIIPSIPSTSQFTADLMSNHAE